MNNQSEVVTTASHMVSPREAAHRTGTTLAFIYHEIASNHFPGARKVAGRWAIPAEEVEAKAAVRRLRGITW